MDAFQSFVLQLFAKLRPDPTASCVFGLGVIVVLPMLNYWKLDVPGQGIIAFVGVLLLLNWCSLTIDFYRSWRGNRKAVYIALQSLSPEEKDILRTMLTTNTNNYEIEIHNNFDENAQTIESKLFSRMRCLKDKGLLDLTQVSYTKNSEMLKGSMPLVAWVILQKEYKKDSLFLARQKKKTGKMQKILRRAKRKKK